MSAEKLYHHIATGLTDDDYEKISSFYQNWPGQDLIDLKFRFIKFFGINRDTGKSTWYNLHHLLNIRRFKTEKLPEYVETIIQEFSVYPLRIFHSCTEWLAPNEVERSDTARIIKSGFIPIENDTDLSTSLQVACTLNSMNFEAFFVYSGNKSVHTWIPFTIDQLSDKQLSYADKREEAEKLHRLKFFNSIQKEIDFPLDRRISQDSRRVVPIINSLNALTMRKVLLIPNNQICELSSSKLEQMGRVSVD